MIASFHLQSALYGYFAVWKKTLLYLKETPHHSLVWKMGGHIPAKWPKSKKIKVLYFLELLTVNDIIWTFLHNMAIFFLLTNIPILRFDNGTVTQTF